MMFVALVAAYLHSAVQSYLATDTLYVSVPPGIHAPPEPSAAELRIALAFTRCMRAHGLSQFPDPLRAVSDMKSLTLRPGEYLPLNRPTEAQAPAFRQAAKACGLQLF